MAPNPPGLPTSPDHRSPDLPGRPPATGPVGVPTADTDRALQPEPRQRLPRVEPARAGPGPRPRRPAQRPHPVERIEGLGRPRLPRALLNLVDKSISENLTNNAKPSNLFETLSRLPDDGVGSRVHQMRWSSKGIEGCYWEISRVRLEHEGTRGKAWGRLVWRGKHSSFFFLLKNFSFKSFSYFFLGLSDNFNSIYSAVWKFREGS